MQVKTNVRAGQGGSSSTSVDSSTSTSTNSGGANSGGANSGGVNSNKPSNTVVYYYSTVSRCVGI